ncbi:hypothetical protein KBA41_01980 [Candidatus Ozemobacteraceae bacterium]|nr:hypothetical protein [Candidatus Ozemobacteraceae bacterium]
MSLTGFRGRRVASLMFALLLLLLLHHASWALGRPSGPAVRDGTFRVRSSRPAAEADLLYRMSADPALGARMLARSASLRAGKRGAGRTEEFLVFDFNLGRYESRSAVLAASGKYCHVYVAKDSAPLLGSASERLVTEIRDTYDGVIHPLLAAWFGELVLSPGLGLADERVIINLCDIRDGMSNGFIAGYFDSRDLDPDAFPVGNLKPVLHLDIDPGTPGRPGDKYNMFYRTLAHECQHMINFARHLSQGAPPEERWLEEGLSCFAEYAYTAAMDADGNGLPPDPHLSSFLENPDIVLTMNGESEWFDDATLYRHYGASFLFIYYLQEKFGKTPDEARGFIRSIVDSGSTGAGGITVALDRRNAAMTFEDVVRHWLIANHIDRVDLQNGFWGYVDKDRRLGDEARGLPIPGTLHRYIPGGDSFVGGEGRVRPNSAHYDILTGSGRVTMVFRGDTPGVTPLLVTPAEPGYERWMSLTPDASGAAEIELDFDANPRYVLVSAIATASALSGSAPVGYRFSLSPARVMLYPIPHPAFPGEFIVVVASRDGAPLATPTVTVKFSNLENSLVMSPTDPASRTVFVGNYTVPGIGEGQVMATLPGGNNSSFSFFNAITRAGTASSLSLRGAALTVTARSDGLGASLLESVVTDLPGGLNSRSRPYLVVLPEAGISEARLSIDIPVKSAGDESRVGLWAADATSDRWIPVRRNEKGFFSDIRNGGRYLLTTDAMPPRIHDAHVDETPGRSSLLARISDDGSGIDAGSIRVEAAGAAVPYDYDAGTGIVRADLARVCGGRQEIALEVSDHAGNAVRTALAVVLAGPLRITQAVAWPNPARGPVTIAVMLDGDGAADPFLEGEAVIRDVSGHSVTVLPLSSAGNRTLTARWDGRNAAGTAVANGVYLFRARVASGNERLTANGRIAILR